MLALYLLVLLFITYMALRCRSTFPRLVAAGMGLCLFAYVFINVAMVTGLMPVVGVPLPLVSYGGTSMLTMMVGLGFVLNAHINRETRIRREEIGPLLVSLRGARERNWTGKRGSAKGSTLGGISRLEAPASVRLGKAKAQKIGRIAQVVEQLTLNQRVVGSSPTAPTKLFQRLWVNFLLGAPDPRAKCGLINFQQSFLARVRQIARRPTAGRDSYSLLAASSSRQSSPVRLAMTVERENGTSSLPSNGNTQGGSRKASCNA